ncbi:glyoxalase [Bacillus sp. M6-12]|uniref:VOC family protein n=1 Tax=Bacillus sp. M6-12 TaxID=2054166 RepID=UPI000C773BE4|nr:VOC family protein [Bacillus sp. M6-12]PLS15940.1 glyoxalase [Bacillus sp. M6-12]
MEFVFKSVHHIQMAAPKGSEDSYRRFFGEILGLAELEKPEELQKRGGVWFGFGNYQIHIGIEEPFSPAKKAHPGLEIENLPALIDRLNEHKIEFIEDGKLPGARRIYLNDPFGNRIELLEWV